MNRKIAVALNPTSDHGRAAKHLGAILEALRNTGVEVADVSAATAAESLVLAQGAVADGIDALIVAGGDGMVHLGLQAVAGTSTPLGIIAIGSGNDNARALDLPRHDVQGALSRITRYLESGVGTRSIDTARITRADGSAELFLGVLSLGLDAHTNEIANTLTWPRGTLRYIRALVRAVRTHKPYGFTFIIDGEPMTTSVSVLAVANGPAFGGGLPIAPNALLDDGLLDLLMSAPLRRREIPTLLVRLAFGKHLTHPKVTHRLAKTVRIEASDLAAVPPVAYADGEVAGQLPLTAEMLPGALTVIIGSGT